MTNSQSPKEGVGRVLPELRVTKPHLLSVASFSPNDGRPSTTLASQKGNTSRTINMKLNKRSMLKKPYPSSLPEQIFASATQQMLLIGKKSPRKQNFSANHVSKYKSKKGKRSEQAEQVCFGTVVGMIRGYTSRKRPREQAEQCLDNKISFPSTLGCQLVDSPIILEAVSEGFLVRRIYVDGGSSFLVIHSSYNVILGGTGLKSLGAVASTIHSMIKFLTANGITTVTTKKETLHKYRRMKEAQGLTQEEGVIFQTPDAEGTISMDRKESQGQTNK
nr:reverse transcriptase domain-containing protein [Tanacetum cinerariifolium]